MRLKPLSLTIRLTLIVAVCITGMNLLALAVRFPVYAAVPLGVTAWKNLGRWHVSTAHGSARPSGMADLLAPGMIGGSGLILGTTAYMEPPGKLAGLAALFSPAVPSTLACRLFLAAFCGKQWMGY